MPKEKCVRCEREEGEVELLDAVSENEVIKICPNCSFLENVTMIKKPTNSQLSNVNRPYHVSERMRRISGISPQVKPQVKEEIRETLSSDKINQLNLVDNFNWLVMMARKDKRLSRKQVADALMEKEDSIKMIENKELGRDSARVIEKLEQFFNIQLRKQGQQEEKIVKETIRERLERIGKKEPLEKSFDTREQVITEMKQEAVKNEAEVPIRILGLDPKTAKNITIDDLRKMKLAREKAEKERKSIIGEKDISELIWKQKKPEALKPKTPQVEEEQDLVDSEVEFEEE